MQEGWICPICKRGVAPQLTHCECANASNRLSANGANAAIRPADDAVAQGFSSEVLSTTTASGKKKYQYLDPDFNNFYNNFPLKRGKEAAFRSFKRVIATGAVSAETLANAALRYAHSPDRKPDFTVYPAKWLNDGRWMDGEAEVSHPAAAVPDIDFEADQRARWAEQGWSAEDEANFAKNGGGAAMAFLNGDDA